MKQLHFVQLFPRFFTLFRILNTQEYFIRTESIYLLMLTITYYLLLMYSPLPLSVITIKFSKKTHFFSKKIYLFIELKENMEK